MRKINPKQIVIGIDTGTNTAFGVWDGVREEIIHLSSVHCDKAAHSLNQLIKKYEKDLVAIGIELPVNKHVYNRKNQGPRAMKKIAHNVGECYAKGKALVGFCEALLINGATWQLYQLRPKMTKMSRREFETYSGYPAACRSNEHQRDAGVMAIRTFDKWVFEQRIEKAG